MQRKLYGIIIVDFDATGQRLIIYSAFAQYLKEKLEYSEAMAQPFIDLKKAFDYFRRETLCNILIEFDISMKLAS
jgi:hypothetical protein